MEYSDPETGWRLREGTVVDSAGTRFVAAEIADDIGGAIYRRTVREADYHSELFRAWARRLARPRASGEGLNGALQPDGLRHQNPTVRRCQRVLLMVHELHKRGYQLLRVEPGFSPSGCYWRCATAPADEFLPSEPQLLRDQSVFVARYGSGMGNHYFDWTDSSRSSARELALRFEARFPDLVARACGDDWAYAGWYVLLLGAADRGALPYVHSDWFDGDAGTIPTDGPDGIRLPMPPPLL